MATIRIDVVSAEEAIYSGEAEFVVLPGIAASWASTRATLR